MKLSSSDQIAQAAIEAALEKKGEDIVLLDLRGVFDVTDLFVVVTGRSDTQVEAISEAILDSLRNQGEKPNSIEGRETNRWVLLDYVDVVVHVMHPDERMRYQLERLWGEAGLIRYDDEGNIIQERPVSPLDAAATAGGEEE